MKGAAPEPHIERRTASTEPGPSRAPSPPLPEILGRPLRIAADPHTDVDDVWARVLDAMTGTFQNEVAKARTADQARLDDGWALLHQATERCRLLDQLTAEHHEQVRKKAEEIQASVADEAKEVLASARALAREILARMHHKAMKIISTAR
jgi:MoxR-like ATPase